MLIEFSVENFMCFKNEVTFSFEAMEDLAKDKFYNLESRRDVGIEGVGLINTVNAIYGKNASGKSSLLRAIKTFYGLMTLPNWIELASQIENIGFRWQPNRQQPMKFKVSFLVNKFVYHYELHIDNFEVIYERLTRNETLLFERPCILKDGIYNLFDTTEKSLLVKHIRSNQLIMTSTLLSQFQEIQQYFQENNTLFRDLEPTESNLYTEGLNWFRLGTGCFYPHSSEFKESIILLLEDSYVKQNLLSFLKLADFTIRDYYLRDKTLYLVDAMGRESTLQQQSSGTVKFFFLYLDVLAILDKGGLYIVDELEKALHPLLARRFINLFKNPETNPKHARLLFSSHDIMFLHHNALNGDQIWFIDRDETTQETRLYCPADYEDFDPLKLQSEYLLGAYDAVPKTQWRT